MQRAASTFSLRACGAAEGAVFISDKMATENNVLASLGIFTADPEGGEENLLETSSQKQRGISGLELEMKSYLVMPSLM